jgi:esterase
MLDLNYKSWGEGFPIVILHGLMGSLDNWQSIAKKLAEKNKVFVIDQRNHGKSPHTSEFNYDLLCDDLFYFFSQHHIGSAHIIGHSMGGKVAMLFALKYPLFVKKLIVVDIAPSSYADQHSYIFESLKSIALNTIVSREQVHSVLSKRINEESTIAFLMKGLTRDDENNFIWRFNMDSLFTNYNVIAGFPLTASFFEGEVLFIKGQLSNYINSENYSDILCFFPKHELVEIAGAGHWVHAEDPSSFMDAVLNFI